MTSFVRRIFVPNRVLKMLLAALAVALPCGCERKEAAKTRVAILSDDVADPMRNYQITLLEKLIHTRADMEVTTLHAGGDSEVQSRQVRESWQGHAAFLMVFPADAEKLTPVLREAVTAGARVFVFSQSVPEDACTSALFADERRLGEVAGQYVVSALKTKAQAEGLPAPKGRVVMLRGEEENAGCQLRAEGFLSAIQPYPGMVLVHDAPADWSAESAADRTREALRIQKQFDVIYAQSDLIAAGASKAVRKSSEDARKAMLIVGTGGVPGAGGGVAMVISGELNATVYQPPLVDAAWREIQRLLDKPDAVVPKRTEVKPFMITPENAAAIQRDGVPRPESE
jgi:ABC-type sugar transport system substrate-binding protein